MDLKEFSQLTLHSANDAKNFLSFMVGYNFPDLPDLAQSEKAIRNLFDSFPEEFKQDTKLFEPVMEKYFRKFAINEDNIQMYKTYITKQSTKAFVMEKNPDWPWENKTLEYKSLAHFLKAFEEVSYGSYKLENGVKTGLQFLEDNETTLKQFVNISKKKSLAMMLKKGVFDYLVGFEYKVFTDFCENYGFDRLEVLKSLYGEGSIREIGRPFSNQHLNLMDHKLFFEDICQDKEYFIKHNRFFKYENINRPQSYNCLSYYFVTYANHNEPEKAALLADYFKEELVKQLKEVAEDINYYNNSSKMIMAPSTNEIDKDLLTSVVKSIEVVNSKSSNCYYRFTQEKAEQFLEYYQANKHHEKLQELSLNKNENVKKVKIK